MNRRYSIPAEFGRPFQACRRRPVGRFPKMSRSHRRMTQIHGSIRSTAALRDMLDRSARVAMVDAEVIAAGGTVMGRRMHPPMSWREQNTTTEAALSEMLCLFHCQGIKAPAGWKYDSIAAQGFRDDVIRGGEQKLRLRLTVESATKLPGSPCRPPTALSSSHPHHLPARRPHRF